MKRFFFFTGDGSAVCASRKLGLENSNLRKKQEKSRVNYLCLKFALNIKISIKYNNFRKNKLINNYFWLISNYYTYLVYVVERVLASEIHFGLLYKNTGCS